MTSLVTDPDFRPKVARALQHGPMKGACERHKMAKPDNAGQFVIPASHGFASLIVSPAVRQVAAAFITLPQAREQADYDAAAIVQPAEALDALEQVEAAFQAWLTTTADPSAVAFLQEMVLKSIIKR